MADNNKIQIELSAIDRNLKTVFAQAEATMLSFNATADKVTGTWNKLGAMVGTVTALLAGGEMFGSIVEKTKEVADEVKRLKEAFGISAEEASVLRIALDDTFVTADQLTLAASKLTKQIVSNEEAFKQLGVSTRDSNGNFRPTIDILTDVNSKLLQFKEGTDRNIEGVKIYGKGWEEARQTLKLTTEALTEAKDRAAELHLIFGEEGLQQVKDYKSAMKDLDDVTESLKVQIGRELLPELTKLSVWFGKEATENIPGFIEGMHTVVGSFVVLSMNANQLCVSLNNVLYYLSGGPLGDAGKFFEDTNKQLEKQIADQKKWLQTLANSEVGLDADGNRKVAKKNAGSGTLNSSGGLGKEGDWNAANNKYIEYLKAFEEKKAAIIKAGADLQLAINKSAYEWGLTDLRTYLATEYDLTKQSLAAELAAKQTEFDNAQKAVSNITPVVGSKGESRPDKDAEHYNAALQKREVAEKALIETKSKLALLDQKYADDVLKAIDDQSRGYQEISIQLMEMQGQIVEAAKAQSNLDAKSREQLRIWLEAKIGTEGAQEALDAKVLMGELKIRDAILARTQATYQAAEAIAQMNGDWDKSLQVQIDLLKVERQRMANHGSTPEELQLKDMEIADKEQQKTPWGAFESGMQHARARMAAEGPLMLQIGEQLSGKLSDELSTAFDGLINGTKTASEAFGDMARSMLSWLEQLILKQLIFNAIGQGSSTDAKGVVTAGTGLMGMLNLATGGQVPGWSPSPTADNIPTWLTAREFVQPVASVDYYGVDFMEAIRRRLIPRNIASILAGMPKSGIPSGYRLAQGGQVPGQPPSTTVNTGDTQLHVINVLDKNLVGDFVKTHAGETAIINMIRRNGAAIKKVLS